MPKINQILPGKAPGGPIESRRPAAEDYGSAEAVGGMNLGKGITDFANAMQKREEQSDLSNLHARMAEAQTAYKTQLSETIRTADPAQHKEISEKYFEKFQTDMDKLAESSTTRAGQLFLEQSQATLKSHLQEGMFAGQAQLAGLKARTDFESTIEAYGADLLNDPSSLDHNLGQLNNGLGQAMASGMDRAVAIQLQQKGRQDLHKQAIRGWINLDPEGTQKMLKEGKWDKELSGELKHQLYGETRLAISGREAELERQKKVQKEAIEAGQKKIQNDFLGKMNEGTLTDKDILGSNLEAFGSGSKEQFLQMLKVNSTEKIKTNPAIKMAVFERIHLPDGDPNKLTDETQLNQYFGKGMTLDDIKQMRDEIQAKGTTQGQLEDGYKKALYDIAKGQLTKSNPMTGVTDPVGDAQYLKFITTFGQEFEKQKAAGKSVKALLDPASPDYLGKMVNMFVRSQHQIMADLTNSMNGPAYEVPKTPLVLAPGKDPKITDPVTSEPKAKNPKDKLPGETPQQWRERTKNL